MNIAALVNSYFDELLLEQRYVYGACEIEPGNREPVETTTLSGLICVNDSVIIFVPWRYKRLYRYTPWDNHEA